MAAAAWQGSTTGRPVASSSGAQVGHPGTAGDQDVGAVFVAQAQAGLDHRGEVPVGQLQHAKPQRAVAGEPSSTPMASNARM